jgi:hypothetical protein
MSNRDTPTNDEEQLATVPTDYRALLAITRLLVITENTLPSWRGGEIYRSGFGLSSEPGDWRAEFTLRRGEIFRSEDPARGTTNDGELATTTEEAGRSSPPGVEDAAAESISALCRMNSNLQIRICLGMS